MNLEVDDVGPMRLSILIWIIALDTRGRKKMKKRRICRKRTGVPIEASGKEVEKGEK